MNKMLVIENTNQHFYADGTPVYLSKDPEDKYAWIDNTSWCLAFETIEEAEKEIKEYLETTRYIECLVIKTIYTNGV